MSAWDKAKRLFEAAEDYGFDIGDPRHARAAAMNKGSTAVHKSVLPPDAEKAVTKMLEEAFHFAERKLAIEYGYSTRSDTVKEVKRIAEQILKKLEQETK